MIYKILKVLVKVTMFFFFKKRIIKNAENIPASGPTILVANHPVTFLDPLLVAVTTKRPVHFLAKGIMFKNSIIRTIFKAFNMIPIYRAQDGTGDMSKNEDTFKFCYEHLEKGGLLLIFPEGISVTNRTLNPLKTGVARIALGAEQRNDFKLGVSIVPIGLTYEAPHQFRKDVLVNVGEPIEMKDFQKQYTYNDRKTVVRLIEKVAEQLQKLILNVKDVQLTPLVDFYLKENARIDMPFEKNVRTVNQALNKITGLTLNNSLEVKVREVIELKRKIGFEEFPAKRTDSIFMSTIVSFFTLLIGIPIFIFGFIHNAIPYYFSPRLAKLISKEYEYQGPITMTVGMVTCLILYPIFFILMFSYCENWLCSFIYVGSLPIMGVITYGFYEQLFALKVRWKLMFLFNRKSSEVSALILAQKELLQMLDKYSNQ